MSNKGISQNISESLLGLPSELLRRHGRHDGASLRVLIVSSRFNQNLTVGLVRAAARQLIEHGVEIAAIQTVWVPGAFEIPSAIAAAVRSERPDVVIASGAVLEGETVHAQTIGTNVSRSIVELSIKFNLPVIDSVVVADTMVQAEERCLSEEHNRGRYAALAALEMATLFRDLARDSGTET